MVVKETTAGLAEQVKDYARRVGFDLVGIAPAEPLEETERITLQRLRRGMLEGMDWFTEERVRLSCDPSKLLPGARSVIVLGKSYLSLADNGSQPSVEPRGRIARFAWGDDYHDLFPPMMARLMELIGDSTGHRPAARFFVDSGPLAEKAVAVLSGLGWYGKCGCLVTPDYGSWVLLGAIVTDLELEPNPVLAPRCSGCHRLCIGRCPTEALVSPYTVDARRCLSYLTIEHRGAIPRELRRLMGNWIFGCDLCLETCPHNRILKPSVNSFFVTRSEPGPYPALLPLMDLDAQGFKQMFRGSPVLRAKRRGLLRNVAVALGNARDPIAVPALARALGDGEWLIRAHAAWALGEIGGRRARAALERALPAETEESVREEIRESLANL